jgi:glycerol kinase
MDAVVALDAGTTGVRAIAFSANGKPLGSAYQEFPQYFPQPGWVEHDATEIWDALLSVMSALKQQLPDTTFTALGITVQRETVVVWDRTTHLPLHRAIVWQDRRTADRCEQLEGELQKVRQISGLVLDPYFSGSKLEWIFSHTDITPSANVAVGTIDSWIVWNLTKENSDSAVHVTDTTNASRTMLCDIRTGEWSDELCAMFSIPKHVLPRIVPSSGRVGTTSSTCPLGAGIPISGIAGDQQASLFGQACFTPGMAKNTYGTGSFALLTTGNVCPQPVDGLLTTVAWSLTKEGGIETTYAYEGAIFVTGAAVQWLRDGLEIIETSAQINELAATVESSDGVVIVPAFTGLGSPWWDPYARGTILGITRGTTRAHLARATLESIALQTADAIGAMSAASHLPLTSLRADGGGASDLILQLQADLLGVQVRKSSVAETTALGAAYLAGLAEGVWTSQKQIEDNWQFEKEFTPSTDEVRRALLDQLTTQWRRAIDRSMQWAQND